MIPHPPLRETTGSAGGLTRRGASNKYCLCQQVELVLDSGAGPVETPYLGARSRALLTEGPMLRSRNSGRGEDMTRPSSFHEDATLRLTRRCGRCGRLSALTPRNLEGSNVLPAPLLSRPDPSPPRVRACCGGRRGATDRVPAHPVPPAGEPAAANFQQLRSDRLDQLRSPRPDGRGAGGGSAAPRPLARCNIGGARTRTRWSKAPQVAFRRPGRRSMR